MRCAVVGHPVAHSVSPAIHRAAYRVLRLDWSYDAIDVEPGGRTIVRNTDVTGAGAALRSRGVTGVEKVVMLGAGATARSVLAAAVQLGADEVIIMSRSRDRSTEILELANRLGIRVAWLPFESEPSRCDLMVSTVPAGSVMDRAEDLAAHADAVFDVIYDPWPTPLTVAGENAGITVIDGLDLLAGQAVDQIRLMTGHDVPMDILRSTAQNALAERARL